MNSRQQGCQDEGMKKRIGIGIIGLGTVGSGVVKLLGENASLIEQRLGVPLEIVKACDLDPGKVRRAGLDGALIEGKASGVTDDPAVDIVVELIGGVDEAHSLIARALEMGKCVVTANKALLAEKGRELFALSSKSRGKILFEASVGGGVPIIKVIREGLVANRLSSILGIVNGTCNFIMSRMTMEGSTFRSALNEAKKRGFAEADPSLDIEGVDSSHKLVILASLATGKWVDLKSVYVEGIEEITAKDILYAGELDYVIKLLAIAKYGEAGLEVRVHPTLIPRKHPLSAVSGVYNAVYVHGDYTGDIMICGAGAGQDPTASAVVSDLVDTGRALIGSRSPQPIAVSVEDSNRIIPMEDVQTRYYFRFSCIDRPGVIAQITTILGEEGISLASILQKERRKGGVVPVVMMTHMARERNVRRALAEIDGLGSVRAGTMVVRVEDEEDR